MLYRDDYYNTDEPPNGVIDVLVRKQRNGDTKEIPMQFDGATVRIKSNKAKKTVLDDDPF